MRLMPIVTATAVTGFLYFLVADRDRLLAFAQAAPDQQTEAAANEVQVPLIKVVAIQSNSREIENAIVVRGRTEAARQVEVRAETIGQVISEPLRKGSHVEAGDVLCQIDLGTREAQLAEARARLAQAEAGVPQAMAAQAQAQAAIREAEVNLTAARTLSADGYASTTRLVGAEAAYEAAQAGLEAARSGLASAEAAITSAKATVETAEQELSKTAITAPFAGLLETDTAELGTFLSTGGACATIIQLDPVKLVGFVPETEVARVTVGAPAGARLASGQEVRGEVTFLSRSADETTRTFRVEVEVPNPDLLIRDGQTAEIIIGTDGQKAHLIPQSALTLDDEGTLGLRTLDGDNVVGFAPVEVVRDTVDGIWVTGLPDDLSVIVIGQEYVTSGVVVDPTYREAAL